MPAPCGCGRLRAMAGDHEIFRIVDNFLTFLIMARTPLAGLNLQICYDIDYAGIGSMPAPCGCGRLNAIAGDHEILRIVDNFLTFLIMARTPLAGLNLQICLGHWVNACALQV